jgi:L-ribulose-5-phosphate 3-epimerase
MIRKINLPRVKETLDEIGYHGWLVIERSRDANNTKDVKRNFSANTAYLKKIFQPVKHEKENIFLFDIIY